MLKLTECFAFSISSPEKTNGRGFDWKERSPYFVLDLELETDSEEMAS